jgi:predicted DsbA family dithiol-disulfide isomerase
MQFRDSVDADWQRSRVLGVTSVPTFVVGKRGLVGAQPYEQLEAFVTSAGAQRREK